MIRSGRRFGWLVVSLCALTLLARPDKVVYAQVPANGVTPGAFAVTSVTSTPAYSFPQTLNVVGWNEFRLSNYHGCGTTNEVTAIQAMVNAAAANSSSNIGSRVVFDCDTAIGTGGPIVVPSTAMNIEFVGNGNTITLLSPYNSDVFEVPASTNTNVGLSWDNFTFIYPTTVPTGGAIFDVASCQGCLFNNIRVIGTAYDFFILGSPPTSTLSTLVSDVQITNVQTVPGGTGISEGLIEDRGYSFPGPSGGVFISNFVIDCDMNNHAAEGAVWNDSSSTASPSVDNNYDVFHVSHGDFERCGTGYDINVSHSTFDDFFMDHDLIDTTRYGPDISFVDNGYRPIFRTRLFDIWAVGGGHSPDIIYQTLVPFEVYDSQIIGGHVENGYPATPGPNYGLDIGPGVEGVKISGGFNAYHNVDGGIYDNGIFTSISGCSLGTFPAGYGGSQAAGVIFGPLEQGGSVRGCDLRGNTSYAIEALTGAGNPAPTPTPPQSPFPTPLSTTYATYAQGNLVATYTNPYLINSGTTIVLSGNSGSQVTPSASASPCLVQDWQYNATLIGCMDTGGNLTVAGGVTAGGHYNTKTANSGSVYRIQLVNGTQSLSFSPPFLAMPVCVANEEANPRIVTVTASSTSATVTSTVLSGNNDFVDVVCLGNPA